MPDPLHIVIPVYNEAANFPRLRSAILSSIKTTFEAYVVYDFDEDNTIPVVKQAIAEGDTQFHLVKNNVGRGVLGALRTGFAQAKAGPMLVVMGDLSDDLSLVDRMVELHRQGYHLVSGSRYMKGGQQIGGGLLKKTLSRVAGASLYWFRGIPTHDSTNAFKLYDAQMVNSFTIESQGGFEISLEITVKAFLGGYRITELPTTWRDRSAGESRFRLWHWLPKYLHWYFYAFQARRERPETAPKQ